MAPNVERLDTIKPNELGEGPHWDAETQTLYFVDIFGKSIHKYVPATKKHTEAVIGSNVTLIIPVKNQKDKFVISMGRELAIVTWDGESKEASKIEKIYEVDNNPDTLDNIINDGKCDPSGRLWAGTLLAVDKDGIRKQENGALYSFQNNKVIKHLSKIELSNGLAWNQELNKFYYIDSAKETVDEYDFDIKNGTISNGKTIFKPSKNGLEGNPDGMTIDTDGNLWVALFGGSKVIKIDPRRPDTLLQTISIPAKQVTSVAFGGPNLDDLYVTTAKLSINNEVLSPPIHGSTYRITGINAKGYPGVSVVL